ncbi:hypothetical protein HJFPF1_04924 [Paramyrothecium foliicola]|nr:hypothetical protein HJFPF1_04924 [Paramyrothecium foliicola]
MTGTLVAPRYSTQDFDTASIRSAAPSYVSEAPSYHSTHVHADPTPPYSPPARRAGTAERAAAPPSRSQTSTPQQQTIGLPPVPRAAPVGVPNLHNFRLPTWSANNALARRQYHSVAERRVSSGRSLVTTEVPRRNTVTEQSGDVPRPLEDPYLVGEVAAANARRERLAREAGDDILIREDKQWDWMLAQMRSWDDRERSWTRYRSQVEQQGYRKKLFRRIGGGLM